MRVVFATVTTSVTMPAGHSILVRTGSHWPAEDPFVLAHPDLFTEDARVGMTYSQPPQPDPPVEQATAAPGERRVLARSQADVAWDDLEGLRAEAERKGIRVDGRWSVARLREELANVHA